MINPIDRFNNDLNNLISSIQSYHPNESLAVDLINDNDQINDIISELNTTNDNFKSYNKSMEINNNQLSNSLNTILDTLVDCKRELDKLPKSCVVDNTDDDNTKEILSYALKLSKFSKIPKTFDGMLLPNNFIWPGDDNLRRGSLAITSIIPDKIINYENFGGNYKEIVEEKVPKQVVENIVVDDESDDELLPERNNSIDNSIQKDKLSVMSGLDLLDSDDE
ncbi:Med4 protein [Pichia kluyveri]|uniref:Mediator of RNA polymerase II transcription subunit 4 n=1 Tax=Pichia kluyveri TaxID=36015 RepID=A0AAV5R5H7_PICKL|nr:Med4 protein [Pichia kluyveri]